MNTLKRSFQITNRCMKWWGLFLVVLLLIGAVALMTGFLTLNANLDLVIVNDVTNPMFVLILFALILFIVAYLLVFALVLPIALIQSFRSREHE